MTPALLRSHAVGGGLALITILTFWVSSVTVELAGSAEAMVMVKRAIPWGLILLVPSLATAGLTGALLARGMSGRLVRRKMLRMRVVAAIGIFILVPCVLYLGRTVSSGEFDRTFYLVQAAELVGGAANIILLGLNVRDGLLLTGRLPFATS